MSTHSKSKSSSPQPQEAVALGLTSPNEAPIRSSTKSTSEPARNGTEARIDQHHGALARDHQIVLGLRPLDIEFVLEAEQPPPSTLTGADTWRRRPRL